MSAELYLTQDGFNQLAQRLLADGIRMIAPVAQTDGTVDYRFLAGSTPVAHLDLGQAMPRRSLKEFFLPPTEPILFYRRHKGDVELQPVNGPFPATVILGARPCDAAALPVLDKVMGWDYRDELWFGRRASATIVSLACAGGDRSCFCTAAGIGPDEKRGSDLLLTPVEGGFFAEPITENGQKLLDLFPDLFGAPANGAAEAAAQFKAAARAQVSPQLNLDRGRLQQWLHDNFEHPFWKELALRCHGCGACASVCPTCHCFDIVDEPEGIDHGARRRNWDTCQAGKFTIHASGHNPRAIQEARFRQRVLHKFFIYPERFEETLCTGCGRCTRTCPGGMDLPEVLGQAMKLALGE